MKTVNFKITPYLNPHPLGEDSDFEIEWLEELPSFVKGTGEDELFTEENEAFFDRLEEIVKQRFSKELDAFLPLLSDVFISEVSLVIDILGWAQLGQKAGYYRERSKPAEGKYIIIAPMGPVQAYLAEEYHGKSLSPDFENVFSNAIIQMLDHANLEKAHKLQSYKSNRSKIKYHLLGYREEGLANLYDFLKGKHEIASMDEAVSIFKEDLKKVQQTLKDTDQPESKSLIKELANNSHFEEVGPWLILQFLNRNPEARLDLIGKVLILISEGKEIGDSDIIETIRMALTIDNNQFLSYLEKTYLPNNFFKDLRGGQNKLAGVSSPS